MANANIEQLVDATIASLAAALGAEFICPIPLRAPGQHEPQPQGSRALVLIPTGTYGYGLWHPHDKIHLVCLSVNSPTIFWELIAEKLQVDRKQVSKVAEATIRLSTFEGIRDSVIDQFRKLSAARQVEIYLHYCPWPANFDPGDFHTDPLPDLPSNTWTDSHDSYLMVRDLYHVAQMFRNGGPDLDFPRLFHRLHTWARAQGILGESHNLYLNSELLFWLLFSVYYDNAAKDQSRTLSENEMFQKINENATVFSEVTARSGRRLISRPHSVFETQAIHNAFNTCVSTDPVDMFQSFCDDDYYFFRIDGLCWSSSPVTRRVFLGDTMSTCLRYLIEHARVWPDPRIEDEDSCTYVLGSATPLSQKCIEHCHALAGNDCSITISLISPSEVQSLQTMPTESGPKVHSTESSSMKPRERPPAREPGPDSQPSKKSSKLPTEQQMLSRLRYDPAHAGIAYELGYLDRFEGMKWMPLEQWEEKPVEDETFIPLTRIRVFRRRDDGVVVWERGKRMD